MTLPLPPLPSLDKPALEPCDPGRGPELAPRHPEAWVRFLDGTSRLVKVLGWRQEGEGWTVHLRWGVSGRVTSRWYRYDPARMTETG